MIHKKEMDYIVLVWQISDIDTFLYVYMYEYVWLYIVFTFCGCLTHVWLKEGGETLKTGGAKCQVADEFHDICG